MQTVDLARAAAAAEVLRLKRIVRRQVVRAAFGVVALAFLVAVLVLLHVVAYTALCLYLPSLASSAILLILDLAVAAFCGVLALRNKPDSVEIEAKALRNQSIGAMKESLAIGTLIGPVGRIAARTLGKKNTLGLTLAALAAKLLAGNRR